MMQYIFALQVRLKYLLKAHYRKGHHIHSPFTFATLNNTIFETIPYYSFANIERLRNKLKADQRCIEISHQKNGRFKKTTIAKETINSAKTAKYAQLLQRLCASNNAQTILELGTNIGVGTMYLAANSSKAKVYTYEIEPDLIQIAKENFKQSNLNNITIIEGDIDNTLPSTIQNYKNIDIIFIDANHTLKSTLKYYSIAKTKATSNSIFIIDDIHWSKEMQQAWETIIKDKDIRLSIDLFSMGIVWFNDQLPKQHYIVSY